MIGSKLTAWRRKASGFTIALLGLIVVCSVAVASGSVSGPAARYNLQALHVPKAITSGQAGFVAALPASQHLKLAINLPVRNQADLDDLLQQLQDPNSPNFHKYLSVDEYTERFGPTQADYNEVVSWAQEKGFTVTNVAPNRRLVDVDGTVDVINHAFNLNMGSYQHPTENRQFFAPDREPTVDLTVPMLQVTGLDNYTLPHRHLQLGSIAQILHGIAHASGSGPSGEYLPSDIRAAYYGSGSLNGAGQSIGIFSFDGYLAADISVYESNTGMSISVPITNVLVDSYNGKCSADGTGSGTCDDGEQILDIVNSIGMAPGMANLYFYEGTSDTDVLNQMATDNKAKVLSSSWGWSPADASSDDPIFQEFQTQGQTFCNATGDSGAFNSSTYDFPSVDPYITQVGGTDLTTSGPGGSWVSETGWADSGGGYVSGTSIPAYQQLAGVITSTNKGSTTLRNSPDIAAEANFDNPTVVNGAFSTGYGGTSFATPRWAGYFVLANQQSVANGHSTVGFVNTSLYNYGISSSYDTDFHDITSGTNKASSGSGSFSATTGYDLVTGWGSPNGAALINALAGGSTATADFSLSASPTSLSVAQGSNGSSTISVSDLNGFSGSVALTASGLPSGVTAAFSPASTTSTSTLTLTASSTATTGTSTVTITGTSGSLTHTTTVSLTVTATATANFSLSASPSTLSIVQGASGTSTLTVTPSNGFTGSVTLAASGLPSGVTAAFGTNPATSTSVLTLTASSTATAGTATVTVTGTSGSLSHTATVSLTVTASGGTPTQLLVNTGFETGKATPWTMSSGTLCDISSSSSSYCGSGETSHAGSWFAWLDGYGTSHTDTVSQSVAIPSGKTVATLQYYLHIDTTKTTAVDTLTVQVLNSSGTVLATVGSFTNLNKNTGYAVETANLAAYIGQTVTIKFTGKETSSSGNTDFTLDDITLTVQ